MAKSIVIVGPQGCGKTLNAPALAKKFGLPHWTDYEGGTIPRNNHLILSNVIPSGAAGLRVIEFKQAIKALVTPHPRTPKGY